MNGKIVCAVVAEYFHLFMVTVYRRVLTFCLLFSSLTFVMLFLCFEIAFTDLMRRIRELWFMVVRFQVGQILQVVVSCFKVRLSLSAFDLD